MKMLVCGLGSDEYDPDTGQRTERPENHPNPTDEERMAAEVERSGENKWRIIAMLIIYN
jgi:hypothetical protein